MAHTVTQRREAKVGTIVASAWKLAAEHGIAGVSLHALAREVGMRQPSLYEYFDSKLALYDAMFADGHRQLLERIDALPPSREPRTALKRFMNAFVAFGLEDPARYELLFQRHVPGFTPSPESYALAQASLAQVGTLMTHAGITRQGDVDCVVAMVAGLMEAQLSNEPGGNRWTRHLNRLVDLYVDDATTRSK